MNSRAVQANVASVMCSYSTWICNKRWNPLTAFTDKINGTFACGNDRTLNQILKTEFAFPGYVMSGQ